MENILWIRLSYVANCNMSPCILIAARLANNRRVGTQSGIIGIPVIQNN
jgi:hypothetical protein